MSDRYNEWKQKGFRQGIIVEATGEGPHGLAEGQPLILQSVSEDGIAHIKAFPGTRQGWLPENEWKWKENKK